MQALVKKYGLSSLAAKPDIQPHIQEALTKVSLPASHILHGLPSPCVTSKLCHYKSQLNTYLCIHMSSLIGLYMQHAQDTANKRGFVKLGVKMQTIQLHCCMMKLSAGTLATCIFCYVRGYCENQLAGKAQGIVNTLFLAYLHDVSCEQFLQYLQALRL